MKKAIRAGVKPIRVHSIKPPGYELDPQGGDDHIYKCVYVTDQGKQVTQRCTHEVWKRCEGRNLEGRPRDGLADKLHNHFIMWVDDQVHTNVSPNMAKGLIKSIDVVPTNYYSRKAPRGMPAEIFDRETIELEIDQTEGYITVRKLAPGVNQNTIERLIKELNKVDSIEVGDTFPGGFEVTRADGKIIEVLPPQGLIK